MSADAGWLLLLGYCLFLAVWALVDEFRNRDHYRAIDRAYFKKDDE